MGPLLNIWKEVVRFEKKKGKLSPRFVGPFEVLARIRLSAYELALPLALEGVHPTFHVSMLRKYVHDPSHIINSKLLQVAEDLTYVEQPI